MRRPNRHARVRLRLQRTFYLAYYGASSTVLLSLKRPHPRLKLVYHPDLTLALALKRTVYLHRPDQMTLQYSTDE